MFLSIALRVPLGTLALPSLAETRFVCLLLVPHGSKAIKVPCRWVVTVGQSSVVVNSCSLLFSVSFFGVLVVSLAPFLQLYFFYFLEDATMTF